MYDFDTQVTWMRKSEIFDIYVIPSTLGLLEKNIKETILKLYW
jgi:hypothetical protein